MFGSGYNAVLKTWSNDFCTKEYTKVICFSTWLNPCWNVSIWCYCYRTITVSLSLSLDIELEISLHSRISLFLFICVSPSLSNICLHVLWFNVDGRMISFRSFYYSFNCSSRAIDLQLMYWIFWFVRSIVLKLFSWLYGKLHWSIDDLFEWLVFGS